MTSEPKNPAAAFRDSEERLKLALDASGGGVWDWNIQTGVVEWSKELEAIHGLEPGTFPGTLDAVIADAHPDDRARLMENVQDAIKHHRPHHIEYRLLAPDGSIKWVEARGTVQFDELGNAVRMVGICSDITRRKVTDELGARFKAVVESSGDAIISETLTGQVVTWNAAAEQIFGYSESEMVGRLISILTPLDRQEEMENMLARARSGETTNHFETVRRHKQGHEVYVSVSLSPVRDPFGNIVGVAKIARDISARKLADKRARFLAEAGDILSRSLDQDETLKNLAKTTVPKVADWNGIYLTHDDGVIRRFTIETADPTRLEWAQFYLDRFPIEQDPKSVIHRVVKTGRGELVAVITDDMLRASARNDEHLMVMRAAKMKSAMIVPMISHGKTYGALTFIRSDVSRYYDEADMRMAEELGRRAALALENARLYAEARAAKEIADAASSAKTSFLANMSHEIRTPLGAILGFSDLLAAPGATPASRAESVAVIQRNGKLLSSIINDILDLSKVEAGRMQIEKTSIDLNLLLEETMNTLRLSAEEKGITLTLGAVNELPRRIETDPIRLKQILNNIVGNAVKFTDNGQVVVRVGVEVDKIVFQVEDTGPGISGESASKLFEPFVQADFASTRRFGGTGLGLALSRHLARLLGGDVELLSSSVGQGSVFKVSIALGRRIGDVGASRVDNDAVWHIGNSKAALKGLRVLLVEDAPDNQLLIERLLKLTGAVVTIAQNGRDGFEAATSKEFDVVLMDVQMPVMDGYEATRRLRGASYSKPIIALTAHAMAEERQKCLAMGFDDHLGKPIDFKSLVGRLRHFAEGVDRT